MINYNDGKNFVCPKSLPLSYREWRLFGNVWEYGDYTAVLECLLRDHKVVTGGDILTITDNNALENTVCGWHYDGDSFLESNLVAQKYLALLAEWSKREELFVSFAVK